MRHLIEVAVAILLIAAPPVSARGTSLKVVARPARLQARIAYSSSDAAAGLGKGAGTDPAAVDASVFIATPNGTAVFSVPAGAFDGTAGWTANDGTRAAFRNRIAPGGVTGVRSLVALVGRKVTLVASSLGDASPLALDTAPTGLTFSLSVANGGEIATHCTRFAAADCAYEPLDAGTGWKLRCGHGVADPSCGAIPTTTSTSTSTTTTTSSTFPPSVCGNGVREHGEECDGGALCTADCRQSLQSCCQSANVCSEGPVFSLIYYLYGWCQGIFPDAQPVPGQVCGADGQCADLPIEPVHLCCQLATSCNDDVLGAHNPASSTSELYYFLYYCNGGAGLGTGPSMVVNASCGSGGTCVPE